MPMPGRSVNIASVIRFRCPGCQHLYYPPGIDDFAPTPNGRALEAEGRCPRCDQPLMFRLTTYVPKEDQ